MSDNRLAGEQSLYLAQHADNPVAWQPWDEAALRLARELNKPILLSIGYSACHWCHVMAHESFEDELTAELMNEHFINIKVDREERPDLDKVYQLAHQALTQRAGGWPLTVFLTPDTLTPFFAGTYFPPTRSHGLPAFREVLNGLSRAYRDNPAAIDEQAQQVMRVFSAMGSSAESNFPDADAINEVWRQAIAEVVSNVDSTDGGFGGAPKFPHPPTLTLLARDARTNGNTHAQQLLDHTLHSMASRGLNDQLGGGFYRYCVDAAWQIPHFEKMLYDNALLLTVYADNGDMSQASRIQQWVDAEMTAPSKLLFSTLDADSATPVGKMEEGAFYTWNATEAQAVLNADEWRVFAVATGMDNPPNFEGRWHLQRIRPMAEVAMMVARDVPHTQELYERACTKLLQARAHRHRPGRDEKVLCAWNALYLKGLVAAGATDNADELFKAIQQTLTYMGADYVQVPAVLNGATSRYGYLDDYAYLLDACLALLNTQWSVDVLQLCIRLANTLLDGFMDVDGGGFYFTHHDSESLIYRPKSYADDAIPAGNALAVQALWQLGLMLSEPLYLNAARHAVAGAWADVSAYPQSHASMLCATAYVYAEPWSLLITGADATCWYDALRPDTTLPMYAVVSDEGLPSVLQSKFTEQTTAWLCGVDRCLMPANTLLDAQQLLVECLND